jgi:peptidyl-prolyl cis-trans isomerase B (cyclophilin B)
MARGWFAGLAVLAVGLMLAEVVAQRPPKPARQKEFFRTSLTVEQMEKEAVIETSAGTFVIQLLPKAAPNHVGYFLELASDGSYNGTTFHRAIKHGIIQGGDPLSRDPAQRPRYGTGGLGVLRAEFNGEPMTAGAVAAVLQPGSKDSGGAQFFVLVTDQPALQGQYTAFGRVVDGLEIVQAISESPVDAGGRIADRVEIRSVTIRDASPAQDDPFSTETVAELAQYRAVLETTKGTLVVQFLPEKAPNHVRNFLRLASLGAYDGTRFHRVVRGFVVQGGMLDTRKTPMPQRVRQHVRMLQPEFSDVPHVKGTVSMARLADPASASTSFFICTGPAPSLDGQYSAFGTVADGLPVLDALEAVELTGEEPIEPLELTRVRVERIQVTP